MSQHKQVSGDGYQRETEHPVAVLIIVLLVALASAGFYLYIENPADSLAGGIATPPEVAETIVRASRIKASQRRAAAQVRGSYPTDNRKRFLDYGGDWGIVSSEMVEAGLVDPADAKVLNEATIQFAGSAAQARSAQSGQ